MKNVPLPTRTRIGSDRNDGWEQPAKALAAGHLADRLLERVFDGFTQVAHRDGLLQATLEANAANSIAVWFAGVAT